MTQLNDDSIPLAVALDTALTHVADRPSGYKFSSSVNDLLCQVACVKDWVMAGTCLCMFYQSGVSPLVQLYQYGPSHLTYSLTLRSIARGTILIMTRRTLLNPWVNEEIWVITGSRPGYNRSTGPKVRLGEYTDP